MSTHICKSKTSRLMTIIDDILKSQLQCLHPLVIGQECKHCGHNVGQNYGLSFEYIRRGLRLSHEAATRWKESCTKHVLKQKKLHLVLDIDHTLLHAVYFDKTTNHEDMEYFKILDDLIVSEKSGRIVKLRPFVRTFLKEASSLFKMYLYTMGSRRHARAMAKLLDPDHRYFAKRIISRDDNPNSFKTLDIVACQERAAIIVDDTRIWPKDEENLVQIQKYFYFADNLNSDHGYLKTRTDESQTYGGLMRTLTVLKDLHARFFKSVECRDIRQTLKLRRRLILEGCVVYVVVGDTAKANRLYEMAMKRGATCCKILNSFVTHVVSNEGGPALQLEKNVHFVNPGWIEAAYFSWERHTEENFHITPSPESTSGKRASILWPGCALILLFTTFLLCTCKRTY
ncbi:hypothetical protein ACFE04_007624 [Oxalis oulophora]